MRMRSQRLIGARDREPHAVVRGVCALQAQDTRAARLAVRARSERLEVADVTRACNEERSLVRTWAMRGTLHMLPAEEVRWIVALLGPAFSLRDRRRRLQLGLDDNLCARALPAIRSVLAGTGPLTRGELVRRLADRGVKIEPTGQAPAHLVFHAATQGLICRGPDQANDEATYVLMDEWLGRPRARDAREPEEAWAELARRYLEAYAPAAVEDFAAWSGAPAAQARGTFQLIAGELAEVRVGGAPAWALASRPHPKASRKTSREPGVRLVPAFDSYLLGYRRRDFALPPRFAARIQAGGGWIHPAVLVDGRVVATWRGPGPSGRPALAVQPFERLPPEILPYIEREAADIGRFLGTSVALTIQD